MAVFREPPQPEEGDFYFPVDSSLRKQIRDGVTLSRTENWWSAALLIEDPWRGKRYVAFYRWENRDGVWKRRAKFTCWNRVDADKIRSFLGTHHSALDVM